MPGSLDELLNTHTGNEFIKPVIRLIYVVFEPRKVIEAQNNRSGEITLGGGPRTSARQQQQPLATTAAHTLHAGMLRKPGNTNAAYYLGRESSGTRGTISAPNDNRHAAGSWGSEFLRP